MEVFLFCRHNGLSNKVNILKLNDVEKTLIIPLWARAEETNIGGIIKDKLSVDLLESIDTSVFNFQQLSPFVKNYLLTAIANRTNIVDEFLNKINGSGKTVLNFGCGLDTRFSRFVGKFDNWYDIDLESVITIRRDLITEQEGYQMIVGDITNVNPIPDGVKGNEFVVVCEGLLMYFNHKQVLDFLSKISKVGKGEIIFESLGSFSKIKINPVIKGIGERSKYKWGINNICDLENDIPQLSHQCTISIFDINKSRWGMLGKTMKINYLKKRITSKISHFSYEYN